VCPGLYFRPHYFILMLPASALLAGVTVAGATEILRKHLRPAAWSYAPILLFIAACAASLYHQRAYLFEMTPSDAYASIYTGSPFPEAIEIGSYLKSHTAPDARIAVLGSEPEIYFYADRRSATGYIYTYGLMEKHQYAHRMQQEMISEIEAARPEYIVVVGVPLSFGRRPDSDPLIFKWMDAYLTDKYGVAGVADMLEPTQYLWGVAAQGDWPRSPRYLKIYKRK
jgi:hypothetical protein